MAAVKASLPKKDRRSGKTSKSYSCSGSSALHSLGFGYHRINSATCLSIHPFVRVILTTTRPFSNTIKHNQPTKFCPFFIQYQSNRATLLSIINPFFKNDILTLMTLIHDSIIHKRKSLLCSRPINQKLWNAAPSCSGSFSYWIFITHQPVITIRDGI